MRLNPAGPLANAVPATSGEVWDGLPLVARLARFSGRLRAADRRRPWIADTALVLVVFALFCLPDLRDHDLGPRAVAMRDAYGRHLPTRPGSRDPRTDPRLAALTDREREILLAIGKGWNNGEIAERMALSGSTVKTHVGRILAKLGARDRVQAVIFAYDIGLTEAGVGEQR